MIVGLGDSVPAARSCSCAGFLDPLGQVAATATGRKVVVHNDAVGGYTSADLVDDLASGSGSAGARDLAAGADLVVVEIGANDYDAGSAADSSCQPAATAGCFDDVMTTMRINLRTIITQIRSQDPHRDVAVVMLGYWNVGQDGVVGRRHGAGYVTGSDQLTRWVNQAIAGVADTTDSTYVDVYTPFKGASGQQDPTPLLLSDGDHPNAAGYARMTAVIAGALRRTGAMAGWKER